METRPERRMLGAFQAIADAEKPNQRYSEDKIKALALEVRDAWLEYTQAVPYAQRTTLGGYVAHRAENIAQLVKDIEHGSPLLGTRSFDHYDKFTMSAMLPIAKDVLKRATEV